MALTTRQAATIAAGGRALGLIGDYVAGGAYVLRELRRTIMLAGQYQNRTWDVQTQTVELERTVRDKDAEIARLHAARPPIILDDWGTLDTIPGLADRLMQPPGVPAINLTALAPDLDPARAYNPFPTVGNAPDVRLDR